MYMISLVIVLFINIPTTLVIVTLDKRWDLILKNCKLSKKKFLGAVKLVLDSSYFSFDGQLIGKNLVPKFLHYH